jgi:hypothetical protein
MKYLIPVLCAVAVFAGCTKKVDWRQLEERDDLIYIEEKPFTGVALEKYPSGRKKREDIVKDGKRISTENWDEDGKLHGLSTWWYENGQKEWEATAIKYWDKDGNLLE